MKLSMKRLITALLCAALSLALLSGCGTKPPQESGAKYLLEALEAPRTGSPGGEWTVLALARSGFLPEDWREGYLAALETALSDCGGVLSDSRYTEYSRAALALLALGESPRSFAGYDLLLPLEDTEKTAAQGAAGISYALLALRAEDAPELKARYIELLLEYQKPGGAFAPAPLEEEDADLTAIALQAMALYREDFALEEEISAAVAALSRLQNADGSFSSKGTPSSESTAQAIIALCALGISPKSGEGFVKEQSVYDALLSFSSNGGFAHTAGGQPGVLSTEQALCALSAAERLESGGAFLYDFSDAKGAQGCSISVICAEALENMDKLDIAKHSLVPDTGVIYENSKAQFSPGESAFDLLRRELQAEKIHFEFTSTPLTGGAYIEGIGNLYEFDCGPLSGWFYSVNGEYLSLASSDYKLKDGDEIVFEYVCSMRSLIDTQ